MLIDKKSLQNMQVLKIKHDEDCFPLPSNYLYIDKKKCIFISLFKYNLYQICASPACQFQNIESQAYFNVLFTTNSLDEAVNEFKRYVKELI